MRIHLNHPTPWHLLMDAKNLAGVSHARIDQHGSRTHHTAFDIILEGESGRRTNQRWPMGTDYYTEAATWDQWGIYLGYVFEQDPEAKTPYYANAEDFHRQTAHRFDRSRYEMGKALADLVLSQSSPDYKITPHRWEYRNGVLKCKGHSAAKNMRAECHAKLVRG